MAYIYKITNKVNGKLYVGKTTATLKRRFQEHKQAASRTTHAKRPLYRAFNKYGFENFEITLLEQVHTDEVDACEVYWIETLKTYASGYNATLGGDGKAYINPKLVLETFAKLKVINHVAKSLSIRPETVSRILKEFKVETPTSKESTRRFHERRLAVFKDGEKLQIFNNGSDAARWLIEVNAASPTVKVRHLSQNVLAICNGKRKSCYGYTFSFE